MKSSCIQNHKREIGGQDMSPVRVKHQIPPPSCAHMCVCVVLHQGDSGAATTCLHAKYSPTCIIPTIVNFWLWYMVREIIHSHGRDCCIVGECIGRAFFVPVP